MYVWKGTKPYQFVCGSCRKKVRVPGPTKPRRGKLPTKFCSDRCARSMAQRRYRARLKARTRRK